jgi:hypothetical protein
MNVIAGDKEEVDKSIDLAKAAVTEGLVRSGAVGGLVGGVPLAGSVAGHVWRLGGKKKTVAAGIRVVSPANGLTLVSGSGEVKKSALTFGGASAWESGVNAAGYGSSKDGKMLAEAFMKAFNAVSGQASILAQAGARRDQSGFRCDRSRRHQHVCRRQQGCNGDPRHACRNQFQPDRQSRRPVCGNDR